MSYQITATNTGRSQKSPVWPSYKGKSQLVGTSSSGRVTVFVDPTLDGPGLQNARDLMGDADRVVSENDAIFGTTGGPVNVIVFALQGNTDGTGGADHMGCDYETGADIEVCAAFANSSRVSALFEAELSECSMNGRLCGLSTGEALSRWCAARIGNNALYDFATAPAWVNAGMPDFVNHTDPSDRHDPSIGCGMAFLSWLMSLGYELDKLAQRMVSLGDSGTLAQLYAGLTANPVFKAWPTFQSAILALPSAVSNDDPFGGAIQPALESTNLSPQTVLRAGAIFAAIIEDSGAGKTPQQIVERVRAVMGSPAHDAGSGPCSSCGKGSRRLLPPRQ